MLYPYVLYSNMRTRYPVVGSTVGSSLFKKRVCRVRCLLHRRIPATRPLLLISLRGIGSVAYQFGYPNRNITKSMFSRSAPCAMPRRLQLQQQRRLAAAMVVVVVVVGLVANAPVAVRAQQVVDFRVTDYAKFTCQAKGFRCGYVKDDYEEFDLSDGSQDSVGAVGNQGNNIWSNVGSVDDSLTLRNCQIDFCLVRCNFGCDCAQENGDACELGSLAPTPSAVGPATPEVCPQQINSEVCPMMIGAVPGGNLDNYDCFNFCNGTFVTSCDFGGTCTGYDCGVDRATTDGMQDGIVVGCTKEMLQGQSSSSTSSGSSTSSAYAVYRGDSPSTSGFIMKLFASGAVVAWLLV